MYDARSEKAKADLAAFVASWHDLLAPIFESALITQATFFSSFSAQFQPVLKRMGSNKSMENTAVATKSQPGSTCNSGAYAAVEPNTVPLSISPNIRRRPRSFTETRSRTPPHASSRQLRGISAPAAVYVDNVPLTPEAGPRREAPEPPCMRLQPHREEEEKQSDSWINSRQQAASSPFFTKRAGSSVKQIQVGASISPPLPSRPTSTSIVSPPLPSRLTTISKNGRSLKKTSFFPGSASSLGRDLPTVPPKSTV